MTKPLPTIPGFNPPEFTGAKASKKEAFPSSAGIGHNNPPESERIDLEAIKIIGAESLFKGDASMLTVVLDKLKEATTGFYADPATEDGRKSIKSLAYSLTRSRTIIDDKGKDLNAGLREVINAVDEKRRKARGTIDDLIAVISQPLTEWETKEQLRKNKLDADLAKVKNAIVFFKEPSLAEIDERIATLKGFDGYDWQEYGDAPKGVIEESLQFLNEKRTLREQQIKDQEELARLRAAEASRQVAPQPFISDPAAQHTTDSKKPDAFNIVKAIVPDADHRKEINGRVLNAIMSLPVPVDESQAKAIVIAIVQGKIPNVTINY